MGTYEAAALLLRELDPYPESDSDQSPKPRYLAIETYHQNYHQIAAHFRNLLFLLEEPPPVAMAAPYDQAQMEAIAAAIGHAIGANNANANANAGEAGKKAPLLASKTARDWLNWKRRFVTTTKINRWNDLRKRQELHSSMTGDAADVTNNVDLELDLPAPDQRVCFEEKLLLYENCFVIKSDSELAKVEFKQSRQTDDEKLIDWHHRVRILFERSEPGVGVDDGPLGESLRERFITGLRQDAIRTYLWEQKPDSYQRALDLAHDKQAVLTKTENARREEQQLLFVQENAHPDAAIQALGMPAAPRQNWPTGCWVCNQDGHFYQDCPARRRWIERIRRNDPSLADAMERHPMGAAQQQGKPRQGYGGSPSYAAQYPIQKGSRAIPKPLTGARRVLANRAGGKKKGHYFQSSAARAAIQQLAGLPEGEGEDSYLEMGEFLQAIDELQQKEEQDGDGNEGRESDLDEEGN